MPDETNNRMDELLRDYARERRKAAPPELHPVDRKLLQDEVQKVFRTSRPAASKRTLFSFWPQLAFSGALSAILLIAVFSLKREPVRESTEKSLARSSAQSSAAQPAPVLQPAAPGLPAEADAASGLPANALAFNQSTRDEVENQRPPLAAPQIVREEPVRLQALSEDVREKAEQRSIAQSREPERLADRPLDRSSSNLKDSSSASVTPVTAQSAASRQVAPAARIVLTEEKLALANELTNLGAAKRIRFHQVTNVPAATAATFAPLQSFQLEQLGEQIRFVDRDGSVYTGRLQEQTSQVATSTVPSASGSINTLAARKAQEPQSSLPATNTAVFYFSARGTNRSLGKDVVVTGRYFEKTNLPAAAKPIAARSAAVRYGRGLGNPALEQARRSIVGQAVIASTNTVPLHAIATEP